MCGEKNITSRTKNSELGSPPRVRGKAIHPLTTQGIKGITPACAGKRAHRVIQAAAHRDHPRVCGEKSIICWVVVTPMGSPPRVRGKAFSGFFGAVFVGITPACAGKRVHDRQTYRKNQDHPRVCGEKGGTWTQTELNQGSPPRVRGKEQPKTLEACLAGITPACAGKRVEPN